MRNILCLLSILVITFACQNNEYEDNSENSFLSKELTTKIIAGNSAYKVAPNAEIALNSLFMLQKFVQIHEDLERFENFYIEDNNPKFNTRYIYTTGILKSGEKIEFAVPIHSEFDIHQDFDEMNLSKKPHDLIKEGDKHTCHGESCESCDFIKNGDGDITGCDCTQPTGWCNHTISNG